MKIVKEESNNLVKRSYIVTKEGKKIMVNFYHDGLVKVYELVNNNVEFLLEKFVIVCEFEIKSFLRRIGL